LLSHLFFPFFFPPPQREPALSFDAIFLLRPKEQSSPCRKLHIRSPPSFFRYRGPWWLILNFLPPPPLFFSVVWVHRSPFFPSLSPPQMHRRPTDPPLCSFSFFPRRSIGLYRTKQAGQLYSPYLNLSISPPPLFSFPPSSPPYLLLKGYKNYNYRIRFFSFPPSPS